MEGRMQNSFRFDLKTRWLLLSTCTLLLYCIVPVRRGAFFDLDAVSTWLQFLLFVLTFPLGSLFVMLVYTLSGGFENFSITDQLQVWVIAVALGFLQWFFLIPAIMGRISPEVTALNLSAAPAAPAVAPAHATGALHESEANAATNVPPIPQFDERGRTPFERILGGGDDERPR